MSAEPSIEVRIKSPIQLHGQPVAPGIIKVSAIDAADLIASTRCVLVDPADLALVIDAERKRTERKMRAVNDRPRGYTHRGGV